MIFSYINENNNVESNNSHKMMHNTQENTKSVDYFEHEDAEASDDIINIIGQSTAIKKSRFLINIHSRYDAPVLITGETGTGKELAARGLHYCGDRASKPFVPVNCATLTDDLFSSEIFGHVKGSFTDAKKDKKGLLAIAEKGTLFLDEVDSLSLKSQAALLRFLQESEYRPVGSEVNYKSNVRLIASANCDLEERIRRGEFRADLYYRLYILSVHMPPLRERHGDISILVEHFIRQFDYQYQLGVKKVSPDLYESLNKQLWPGNVRELENLIHRLYLCSTGDVISANILFDSSADFLGGAAQTQDIDVSEYEGDYDYCNDVDDIAVEQYDFSKDKKHAVEKFEEQYVNQLMQIAKGNVTLAAKICGKERRAFGKLVKKYNIKKILPENTNIEA